jgi:hypothetical protein
MAQVYSVNAVGYVNVTLKKNIQIVANPLDAGAGNNTIAKLLGTGLPDGTLVYKYVGNTFKGYSFEFGEWNAEAATDTLMPGEGAFVILPGTAADTTVTFVGEVAQGAASNMGLVAGVQLIGSKVPQAGKLQGDLKFPAADGDLIYQWNYAGQTYAGSAFDFGEWAPPGDPSVAVAEGFWAVKAGAGAWDRNFSVNQ